MSIEIISHRGYWKAPEEKNKKSSFKRSFSLCFGTETDIRDMCGELVISHDPPIERYLSAEEFLLEYIGHNNELTLALNIKADGLQKKLYDLLKKYSIKNYFVFDMSIPDTIPYIEAGMNVFIRQSEYERASIFIDKAKGVWLDSFVSAWFDEKIISNYIECGKKVCIVSPELHRREHLIFWSYLRQMNLLESGQLMLCTDLPEHAKEFFNA